MKRRFGWENLPLEKLFKLRINELSLSLAKSALHPLIEQVQEEVAALGLSQLRPTCYLSDEWFSPEGLVAIAIPFYLTHPRLIQLEETMMCEAEGSSPAEFLRLLRHEFGHCFEHAYGVSRLARWRTLFGSPDVPYEPEKFVPRPHSRRFVRHLDGHYAQAHPDEDFAETFATVITPASHWRDRYQGRPLVLKKCAFVASLIEECRGKRIKAVSRPLLAPASHLKITLEAFYARHLQEAGSRHPRFYDKPLKRIFLAAKSPQERATRFYLAKYRDKIIEDACLKTGLPRHRARFFFDVIEKRSQAMNLMATRPPAIVKRHLTDLLVSALTH